jgi:hypothetical protein
VHRLRAEHHLALVGPLGAGQQPGQRGLPRTGRAGHRGDRSPHDLHVDTVDGGDGPGAGGVPLPKDPAGQHGVSHRGAPRPASLDEPSAGWRWRRRRPWRRRPRPR